MMEHRIEKRIDLNLMVVLHKYGVTEFSGTIINLSPSGAFIETDYRPVYGQLFLEVEVVTGNESISKVKHIKALIVHFSENGIGLMTKTDGAFSGFYKQLSNSENLQKFHKEELLISGIDCR